MTIIGMIGMALVGFAVLSAGYSAVCLCRARKFGRNPRPFVFSIFSLLSFAILNFFWVLTGYSDDLEPSFKILWLIIYFSFIFNIAWLVYANAGKGR